MAWRLDPRVDARFVAAPGAPAAVAMIDLLREGSWYQAHLASNLHGADPDTVRAQMPLPQALVAAALAFR